MHYARPTDLSEALAIAAEGGWLAVAGGTDVYPAHVDRPIVAPVLDLGAISALRGIRETTEGWFIGAGTTWTEIAAAVLPPAFRSLQQAAAEIGSIQIQNRATIGGNICNASPAADGVPPLLALDAVVEIAGAAGRRFLPLAGFIRGNRTTALLPGELIVALRVPRSAGLGTSRFIKLGARRYLVISIAMAAARLHIEAGVVRAAALAIGACSAVATRLPAAEAALELAPADASLRLRLAASHLDVLTPIDDVRATADYRREAALELLRRCVDACLVPT
jgi:CO/xanthine dehydrogenase FAD-binding subunit